MKDCAKIAISKSATLIIVVLQTCFIFVMQIRSEYDINQWEVFKIQSSVTLSFPVQHHEKCACVFRAKIRMEGENVFGNKIKVEFTTKSPQKTDKQQGK